MTAEIHQTLGEIKGLLTSLDKKVDGLDAKIDKQDERLRKVEGRSLVSASVAGGVMSVAVGFATALLKDKLGS